MFRFFVCLLFLLALASSAWADKILVRPEASFPLFFHTNLKYGSSALKVRSAYQAAFVLPGPYFGGIKGRGPFCPVDLLIVHGRNYHAYSHKLARPILYINEATGKSTIYRTYAQFRNSVRVTSTTTAFAADYTVTEPKTSAVRTFFAKGRTTVKGKTTETIVFGWIKGTRTRANQVSKSLKRKYGVYVLVWLDGGSSASQTSRLPYQLAFRPMRLFKV